MHAKLKDQICEHCGAGFSKKDTLKAHVDAVHFKGRYLNDFYTGDGVDPEEDGCVNFGTIEKGENVVDVI